jgi:hypothetical protein
LIIRLQQPRRGLFQSRHIRPSAMTLSRRDLRPLALPIAARGSPPMDHNPWFRDAQNAKCWSAATNGAKMPRFKPFSPIALLAFQPSRPRRRRRP